MNKKYRLLIITVLIAQISFAQKQTTHHQQIWTGYFNQTRYSEKLGMWLDVHLRTKEDFANDLSTAIARLGITYYVTDNVKLTGGYAYINHFPADNHANISQPEHRPWQQIQWHTKYPKLRLMQWVRLEERFRHKVLDNDQLADGYNFNYRLRYNFFMSLPLNKNAFAAKTFSFVLNDELHTNFGKGIIFNYFDQNRFFLGFSYHTNTHDNIQFGYMNLFQQLSAGNRYKDVHAIRIFYFHNLDLRKNSH